MPPQLCRILRSLPGVRVTITFVAPPASAVFGSGIAGAPVQGTRVLPGSSVERRSAGGAGQVAGGGAGIPRCPSEESAGSRNSLPARQAPPAPAENPDHDGRRTQRV